MSNIEHVNVSFPDGSTKSFPKGISPAEIAAEISHGLARKAVVARVDGKLVDLSTPLNKDCSLEIITTDDPAGMEVFWHSTSHVMAHAIKNIFPEAQFGVGPPIENGFYYDIDIDTKLTPEDLEKIEKEMRRIIEEGMSFQREELSREEAIEFFRRQNDQYKLELLSELDDDRPSLYHEGDFTDLCRGPHLPTTKMIKSFKLLSVAGAYWRGNENNKMLQRIYGISFPKKAQLDEFLHLLEEAKKRDHKRLGKELDLFSFQPEGPGFVFWHPRGMIVYNLIEKYIRGKLRDYGYGEVKTPIILNNSLWKKSGHWDNYKENMYFVEIDESEYAVKPMNCPGACLIYRNSMRSYRDLPLRFAEFGNVHRYERSGVLNGLFRVRQFTQDDAHIYCTPEQMLDEVQACIRLVNEVYRDFEFNEFRVELSTRPEKSIGSDEIWERAEGALKDALEQSGTAYELNPGDGAFYGPKIDFHIRDSLKRSWQLGTIQLDFSMPERFELEYVGADGQRHRPVMIHRAIFGSIERFIAQIIEHHGGRFPFWLSPVQIAVLPLTDAQADYADAVTRRLKSMGFRAELDSRSEKIGYKIREAETGKIPYMLILGPKEVAAEKVAVRKHGDGDLGQFTVDELITKLHDEFNPVNSEK